MAHDVFVSHSVKDKAVADAIVARLEADSVTCWIAPRDVVPGADWGESIIDAIESSRIMILLFSQSANASPQIKREVERAVNKGVYIIPFRVEDIPPTRALEYFISTSQWMDAFSPPLERHLDNLAKTVRAVLKSPPLPAANVPAQPEKPSIQKSPIRPSWRKSIPIAIAIVGLLIVGVAGWYLIQKKNGPPEKPAVAPIGTSSPVPITPPAVTPIPTLVPTPAVTRTPVASSEASSGAASVVNTAAQTVVLCYHRLVDKVRYPGTEITPAAFEAQMNELKNRGIAVIGMQDLLAWKRGEKNIPPRCAVITFDDGWKSQYEVAWPIIKKFGYPFTMFIYTEGVRGGSLGGGEAITWEQLADMRDNGVDIEAHSATHQDLREGHTIMLASTGGKRTKATLTGPQYEQWMQNEVVGSKQLLEQRLGIKVNCFAVPFGNYNEHVKELLRNAGYQAILTLYGKPITYSSPLDSLGRYAIEANKPQVFTAALEEL